MSKKNSLAKRLKHHEYQIRIEKEREELAKKRQAKRQNSFLKKEKKPKVEPVISAEAKKAKTAKKALAKQLKSLAIGEGKKKEGIHHRKMSDDSSDSSAGEEAMDIDQVGVAKVSKGIKKQRPMMSRATFTEMKKVQKRLAKSGK